MALFIKKPAQEKITVRSLRAGLFKNLEKSNGGRDFLS